MPDFDTRMIALAASAARALVADAEAPFYNPDPDGDDLVLLGETGGAFIIPVLVPTELETGDGRSFDAGSLSLRDLPLPLLWQVATAQGHDGSVIVGRIESIETLPDGGFGNARGVFDVGPYGAEAERLVRGKFLRGVSADLDKFEGAVVDDTKSIGDIPSLADGDDPEAETEDTGPASEDVIKSDKINVSSARVTAATLVAKPAFQESYITMADDFETPTDVVPDGIYEDTDLDDLDSQLASLAASAAPVTPPRSWFTDPALREPTPLTVDDDGRVFGHIAAWHVQHIGLPTATRPPRSRSGYAYFQTGVLRTDDGSDVNVGQLTLSGGHAALSADASSAVKHYDDTASAIADVRAGEDAHGIWVAGSLRPGVTPEQVRVLRASAPSGDWRPINGRLELVAVCQVNVPGFPVARAMIASGAVTALVAAGAKFMAELREQPMHEVNERLARLETQHARTLTSERAEAAARLNKVREERSAALVASAAAAKERIRPTRDARKAEREAAVIRFRELSGGFKVLPKFEEEEHPRHDDGKFRQVVARLNDLIGGVDGASQAVDQVKDAADSEDKGDSSAAQTAAESARDRLVEMRSNVEDPAAQARIDEAANLLDSALSGVNDSLDEATTGNGPVDAVISYLLNAIVSQVDPTQAIRNAPEQVARDLRGKEFKSTAEMASYIQELIRRQVSPI